MSKQAARLHHVGIVVRDLQASVDWYRDHLAFERVSSFSMPGVEVAMIAHGDASLELFQAEHARPVGGERQDLATVLLLGGVNHFALLVDDLERMVEALIAKGVEIVLPPSYVPDGSGDRFAYIRDNERTFVELYQPKRE